MADAEQKCKTTTTYYLVRSWIQRVTRTSRADTGINYGNMCNSFVTLVLEQSIKSVFGQNVSVNGLFYNENGIITPIYKKGDSGNPGNYRGITVTQVILKVLEHILNRRHKEILNPSQSRLQRGFTTGCSSLNAAVIVSECIQESKNTKQNLLFTTLDAQKAFDVVDQNSLLGRLYLDGIHGDDWLLIKDLYTLCSSRVKWAGLLSDPFNLRQGVRQGGILSTSHYKRYYYPLLLQLEERYADVKIGSINIPHITVADDLAVMSRKYSSQQIKIWDVENNTQRERYCVNPSKSSTLVYPYAKSNDIECTSIFMAGDTISNDSKTTHLGIHREVNDKPNIEEKINIGRKAAYSIMGAGFHSGNGLKMCLNGYLWSAFVVPRITYGLEVLSLRKKDIEMLEKFQRKSLKQLQSLPDKTPNVMTLGLLGILPMEVVIDKNALNLFMNIISNKDSIEYQIAERQLAMKDSEEKSWFNYIKSILEKYKMPSVYALLEEQPSKSKWKQILKQSVHSYVEALWTSELESKQSLKYVNPVGLKVGKSHPVWSSVRCNVMDNRRAQVKCKLLTGTYILQGNRAAFNQHEVDPTCKLCSAAPETRQHFLTECTSFSLRGKNSLKRFKITQY